MLDESIPNDSKDRKRKKGTRKDLVGLGNAIDDYATNILIKKKATGLIEKYKKRC